ncbi:phosphoribosylanthranilate isomerase [Rosettibacter firmus]|uniref:phosphoribosylanthranilate isomerase n=1 Tax=Rosettibacter firmus TaxID=3111522 RepID=UPI00336BC57F
MRVKICGITNLEDALLCCNLGADALGFVFYEKSKRYIDFSSAKDIIKKLPAFVLKVGVFVDNSLNEINEISRSLGLNAVQLHGEQNSEFVNQINLPVIKSFRINDEFDFSILNKFQNCSFLLDTYSNDSFGGTGKKFKWDLIPAQIRNNIILAGGISVENVEYIFNNIKPQGVDLSSSVEKEPGKKDPDKLKEFFRVINNLRYS